MPALLAAVVVCAAIAVPALIAESTKPEPAAVPAFPTEVSTYSWWTAGLGRGDVPLASAIYQNGFGVEFFDLPQAVALGADGSTYRRLSAAEGRSAPADQGDPARSVLSEDGTFAVIAGPGGRGDVLAVTLADGSERSFAIGEGRHAMPTSIAGDRVLLLTDDEEISRYTDVEFRLHVGLSILDLASGEITDLEQVRDVDSAALSPDGSMIVARTGAGLMLLDADGSILAEGIGDGQWYIDGDAWAPDGARFAATDVGEVHIVDASGAEHTVVSHPVDPEYSSAIGWRDDDTVLVAGGDGSGDNVTRFAWLDVDTGAQEVFSTYRPDFTGAAMGSIDVARDLVPAWRVEPIAQADRGGTPLWLAVVAAALAAGVVWLLTPRRRPPAKAAPAEPVPTATVDTPEPAGRGWQT
jgi:hypothetical protein